MELSALLTGFFFIVIGYIVKAYPNSIAGYNTMSKERKEYVDIDGLSSFMKRGFISTGIILVVGFYLFHWAGIEWMANAFYVFSILAGTIYIVIRAKQFDHFRQ